MRGRDDRADGLFSYVRLEERIPADHPLRAVRRLADEALPALNGRFEALYSSMGRPSIAPEMLLRATLLQAFFSVRSELSMLDRRRRGGRVTLGTDKAYDVSAFVQELRERKVTPHIAVNGVVSKGGVVRRTAVDGRTTRHAGYAVSQRARKRVEEVFGWI